jgi:PAS domain S-box-containing protein
MTADGTLIEANRTALAALGLQESDVLGMPFWETAWWVHSPEEQDKLKVAVARAAAGELVRFETFHLTPESRVLYMDFSLKPVRNEAGNVCLLIPEGRDITDRKHAEAQLHKHREELAHLSRLGTMAEMATGLAHELNQPLASIVNYTSGCVQRIQAGRPDLDELVTVLKQASSEAQRAGEIIRRIRRFVQKREPGRTTIDISKLIQEVLHLMHYDLQRQAIQTRLEVEEHLPTLQGDRIQLKQVLLNLLRNSVEAMEGTEMKHRHLAIGAATNTDDSVTIFVRDSGCGLGEVTRGGIFDPFYTTKKDGMGMGLAICRTIVEAHGGRLGAKENGDVGCTVSFSLPRHSSAGAT